MLFDRSLTPAHASLIVILSGVLYGHLGFFGTFLIQNEFTISAMLFWRFFIAGLFITISLHFTRPKTRSFFKFGKKIIFTSVLSALAYSTTSALYFLACQQIGTGLSMVLFFLFPVGVVFINWILHQQIPSKGIVIAVGVIIIGMSMLQYGKVIRLTPLGIVFGVLSAVSFAFYIILSKQVVTKLDTQLQTQIVCFGSAFFFLIASFPNEFVFPTTVKSWGYILAISIIATALPVLLLSVGLKYIDSTKASILSVFEPVTTVLIGALFLKEELSLIQMIGVFIIMIGALLVEIFPGSAKNDHSP